MVQEASGRVVPDEVARALFNVPAGDGIDRALVTALVWDESDFRPDALGAAGEVGMAQLSEIALQDIERLRDQVDPTFRAQPERLREPAYAARAATYFLRLLNTHYFRVYGEQLSQVGNREQLILTWYKAGPGQLTPQGLQLGRRAADRAEIIRAEQRRWQADAR